MTLAELALPGQLRSSKIVTPPAARSWADPSSGAITRAAHAITTITPANPRLRTLPPVGRPAGSDCRTSASGRGRFAIGACSDRRQAFPWRMRRASIRGQRFRNVGSDRTRTQVCRDALLDRAEVPAQISGPVPTFGASRLGRCLKPRTDQRQLVGRISDQWRSRDIGARSRTGQLTVSCGDKAGQGDPRPGRGSRELAVQSFFAADTSTHTIALLPSWSAITVSEGALLSSTMVPPAARAAAIRSPATSGAT